MAKERPESFRPGRDSSPDTAMPANLTAKISNTEIVSIRSSNEISLKKCKILKHAKSQVELFEMLCFAMFVTIFFCYFDGRRTSFYSWFALSRNKKIIRKPFTV